MRSKEAKSGQQAETGNFIWNAVGGMLNAGQSVFLLIIITRICGLETAGIFSIAFATGNLFMYVGNYGVRNYQVSDQAGEYAFADYLWHRVLTICIMLAAAVGYSLWSMYSGSYSLYKAACVFAMCVLKAVDCAEEVFEGRYQQRGRLDLAGKLVTIRLLVSIGGMMLILAVTGDLLKATVAAVLLAIAASAAVILCCRDTAACEKAPFRAEKVGGLLKACFPVFAANFLSFYLINEPKYAIDAAMDETAQACYNFIAMPVFVIQLLNMFLYQPMLLRMTVCWERQNKKEFLGYFYKLSAALLAVAVPVLLAAWLLGIPVLSWLYATDLTSYRVDLLLILLGGVFLAFNGFYCAVLTITRQQNTIPFVYLAGAVISFVLTPVMVQGSGIRGAVVSFLIVMALVTALLSGVFIRTVKRN